MRQYLALATALVSVAACTGEKAKSTAADSAAPATSVAATPPVITITAKDFAYEAPDTVMGGLVTLKLVNQGPGLHHVSVLRLSEGKTVADLEAGLKSSKPGSPPPPWVHEVPGPNAPVPGGEDSITVQLVPGNYALVCFIPGADSIPHFMKGMVRALTVVPSTAAAAPAPTADINIKMMDYAWDITPAITAGKHMIRLENDAEQSHEMFIAQLGPGKTPADVAKWVDNQVGPPPGKPLGGVSGMAKGEVAYLPIDLAPGEYGIFCFLTDVKDGKTHAAHGMLKQLSVK